MAVDDSRVANRSDGSCREVTHCLKAVKSDDDDEEEMAGTEKPSETGTLSPSNAEDDKLNPELRWGWMVTLGVFVNYVLVLGLLKSTGLIFVELLEKYQAASSFVAMLFAIRNAVYSIGGFVVMNVMMGRVGARRLVLLGGLFLALSTILSSFANQLALLICLQAGLLGYIQDVTGSYVIVYHLIGLGIMISGGIFCFLRPIRHFRKRKQNSRNPPPSPAQNRPSVALSKIGKQNTGRQRK